MYTKLHLDHKKWFPKNKVNISTHRSKERPFSFLKGKHGDTKETGDFLIIQDTDNFSALII